MSIDEKLLIKFFLNLIFIYELLNYVMYQQM